ncbi:septal ring lytic transglycosylase RlpA family protein [Nonomuraea sp. NPDC052265]|uniref:septal ring lytic transglycosylase RlpA family protein n=1 Tax=Nonomuraea sp. NPDC052265 TaxID=3364374 RepID=UPI0037C8985B
MGQHSHKSSPNDRRLSPGKRRWTAIAAGAAVVAAASTTAWAAVGNDAPGTTTAKDAATAAPSARTSPNTPVAAKVSQAKPMTPAPSASSPSASTSTASGPGAKNVPDSPHGATPAPKAPGAARPDVTETPASETAVSETAKTAKTVKPVKLRTTKPKVRVLSSGTCGASYYGEPQMTASGERFNPSAMTAAHKSLPLGSRVRVTNSRNGSSVTVRINDRGPYVGGRCLDLSRAAFDAIGSLSSGVMTVRYEVLAR